MRLMNFFENKRGVTIIQFFLILMFALCGLIIGLNLHRISKEKNNLLPDSARSIRAKGKLATEAENFNTKQVLKYNRNNLKRAALSEEKDEKLSSEIETLFLEKRLPVSSTNIISSRTDKISDAKNRLLRLKDYIKSIEEKSVLLKEKTDLLNNLLASKEKEISKLNEDNASLKENLNKAVEAQNRLKAEFDANLNNLNAQLALKNTEVEKLNAVKLNLENQINDLNNKLTNFSNAYSALEKEYSQAQQEKAPLETELNNTKDGLEKQARLLTQSQQEKTSLETELNKIKEDLKKQAELNDTLNNNISKLTETLDAKEKDRLNIVKELEQLQASKSEIESELNKLKVTKYDNENQINQLNLRLHELNILYEGAKSSVSQSSNILAKKESEMSDMQNEISKIKDSLHKVNSEKENLLLSLEEKEKSQAETMEKLNEAISLNNFLKKRLKNIYMELELLRAEKIPTGNKRKSIKDSAVMSGLDEFENKMR